MAATTQMYVAIEHAMADDSITYDETIDAIREIVGTGAKGRRIVQITSAAVPQSGSAHPMYFALFALCDDGTLWQENQDEWSLVSDVPQVDVRGIREDAPAESHDPIAELEGHDARILVVSTGQRTYASLTIAIDPGEPRSFDSPGEPSTYLGEELGASFTLSDLRAAAARLLERVKGAK